MLTNDPTPIEPNDPTPVATAASDAIEAVRCTSNLGPRQYVRALSSAFTRTRDPLSPAVVDRALLYAVTGALVLVLAGGAPGLLTAPAGPHTVIVNSAQTINQVTAAAVAATPSVVTISVSEGAEAGTGSGVILSADGYILTNAHVVTLDGAAASPTIRVKDASGRLTSAKLIGVDANSDLAVIKIDGATGLTPATWADSSKLNVGDLAVAIGAPLGLSGTVTTGIVSALNRSISVPSSAVPTGTKTATPAPVASVTLPVIQTDAAINHGNSGGPLLNSRGQVIGINVAIADGGGIASATSGSIGVGFAIPSNFAQRVAGVLKVGQASTHGLLGATVSNADIDESSAIVGALIKKIVVDGPSEHAGLRAGDIITGFNGMPITSSDDVVAQTRAAAAGSTVDITYVRDGVTATVSIVVGSLAG